MQTAHLTYDALLSPFLYIIGLIIFQVLSWRLQLLWCKKVRFEILQVFIIFAAFPLLFLIFGMELRLWLLLYSLCLAYLMTYPAAAAKSPSLLILLILKGEKNGLPYEEIKNRLSAQVDLVGDRMSDLKSDGLMKSSSEKQTTFVGRCLGAFFYHYRRWIGLEAGGG